MDRKKLLEEKLREAACIGDTETVEELVIKGVDINAQHSINGWTPLHWACKRGHFDIANFLITNGADKGILTETGESPVSVCSNPQILRLLGVVVLGEKVQEQSEPRSTGFVPSYIKSAPINPRVDPGFGMSVETAKVSTSSQDELVLKVRIANTGDPDFIEIEVPKSDLTYSRLLRACCEELGVGAAQVIRLRKLPNTKLRKDKDVQRLQNFQEIEIVTEMSNIYKYTQNCNGVLTSPHQVTPANSYQSISKKDQTILY